MIFQITLFLVSLLSVYSLDMRTVRQDCESWMYPNHRMSCGNVPKTMKHHFCHPGAAGDIYVLALQDNVVKGDFKIRGLWKADCYCNPAITKSFNISHLPGDLVADLVEDWSGISPPKGKSSECYGWVHEWICHGACLGLGWDVATFFSRTLTLFKKYARTPDQYQGIPALCFRSDPEKEDLSLVSCSTFVEIQGISFTIYSIMFTDLFPIL